MLILAGDVSDDLPTLRQTLAVLKACFAHVFFTPGELVHDAVVPQLWQSKISKPLGSAALPRVWTH